jgi:peptide chain release factor 1
MIEQLEALEAKFLEVEAQLQEPDCVADPKRLRALSMSRAELEPVVAAWGKQRKLLGDREGIEAILSECGQDAELREMALAERTALDGAIQAGATALKALLVPKDPRDARNVILELRAGTGGDEAALFVAELFRMYARFAERKGFSVSVLDESEAPLGGLREVVVEVGGVGAYSFFRFEGGTHRVQRVPRTEAQGRVHTSAATVAVMPEVDELEVDLKDSDLRVDTFCSGGKGGQSVNTTYSAVRVTHLPTGLFVKCQETRSQIKNLARAMGLLRSRMQAALDEGAHSEQAALRKSQVGNGDRSEKIRTYNFPQNRVTDHRIDLTLHQLDRVMEGELDPIVAPLREHHEAERLKACP